MYFIDGCNFMLFLILLLILNFLLSSFNCEALWCPEGVVKRYRDEVSCIEEFWSFIATASQPGRTVCGGAHFPSLTTSFCIVQEQVDGMGGVFQDASKFPSLTFSR